MLWIGDPCLVIRARLQDFEIKICWALKMNTAAQPKPVEERDCFDDKPSRWMSMHHEFLANAKEKEPEVLFIGDSHIERLIATDIWRKKIAFLHCLNFGIGGDRTEHVLWRLMNGELDHISPKVVVLLVGTNNTSNTPQEIAEGIIECVKIISSKQPQPFVVVLKLPPKGQFPNPFREKNEQVNKLLPQLLKDIPRTQLVDTDPGFVQADGSISFHDMNDFLHLTQQAYTKAFEPIYDLLTELLSE